MLQKTSNRRLIVGALALAALSISVPFLVNRLNAKGTRFRANSQTKPRHSASHEHEDFYDFVGSLPSYHNLESSLDRLTVASEEVLKTAALEDPERLAVVTQKYRESLSEVYDNYESLAGRVGSVRATEAFEELCMNVEMGLYGMPADFLRRFEKQQQMKQGL